MSCDGVGLVELLKELDSENLVGVEIGLCRGGTTRYLLENLSNLHLIGIDPYQLYIDWNGNAFGQEEHLYFMLKNVEQFTDRFTFIRKTSDDAVEDIIDGSLDFIFIDGLHTYDQVLIDCRNYFSKVKEGGIFSGHDYYVIPEVKKAVDEFANEMGVNEIKTTNNDVWYWKK